MNKWRLGVGLFCLAFGTLLSVLNEVRPEGTVVFMVDGVNMPFIPIIGLSVLGLALIGSSLRWSRA